MESPSPWKDGVVLAPDAESLITRALRVQNGDAWQKVENGSMVFFIFGFVNTLMCSTGRMKLDTSSVLILAGAEASSLKASPNTTRQPNRIGAQKRGNLHRGGPLPTSLVAAFK